MKRSLCSIFAAVLVCLPVCCLQAADTKLKREAWSFDRSQLEWENSTEEAEKKAGTLKGCIGWVEYDVEVQASGWHELWIGNYPAGWMHDVFLDGKPLFSLSTSDAVLDADPKNKGWTKETNVYLEKGPHKLRFRRLNNPGGLPAGWELRPSGDEPGSCVRVIESGDHSQRVADTVTLKIEGGSKTARIYELVARQQGTEMETPLGKIEFPVIDRPVEKTIQIRFPQQGVFDVVAKVDGKTLRPADFKVAEFAIIDTKNIPAAGTELKTTTLIDINCAAEPPKEGFWEKDGKTNIKELEGVRYRESSGMGSAEHWATDGFSYRFDLPDADHLYRLRVEYPDNERRSMGFWINDGANVSGSHLGVVNGGGIESGDHYPLTNKVLSYESFFYPRKNKNLVVAVLNLVPGMKAAACRIRIEKVDGPLSAAPMGEVRNRDMGFYFEEPGRWLRFFGGDSKAGAEGLKTMERWAQWNRYIGANLMFPTINVYQNNQYPSKILEGYFNTPLNETRMAALVAEKYGQDFVPEFHMSGQRWFDKHVMGISVVKGVNGNKTFTDISFLSKDAEEMTGRDRDGSVQFGGKPFGYNALHPKVQEMYISVFGELADLLADCKSFKGISSRMMLSWQYQGWNTVQSLNWGYEDWTIKEFSKDTGIKVPGEDGKPERFRQRYDFLTGPVRDQWIQWRCNRIFDYHKRLLARIQKAKPDAQLFFTYTRTAPSILTSPDIRVQLQHAGVDLKLYDKEPGIVIMPTAMYGRRYSTPVGDAEVLEALNHPSVKEVARSGGRGISFFSNYYEVNKHLDWSKLGGTVPYAAFDACIPSGINERELYAIGMADSDCSFLVTGGNGWIFGSPALMQPFLREYRALPAKPFDRFEKAVDPVAVWQYREKDGSLWFYAVNRLGVPVTATLALGSQKASVHSAAGGEELSLRNNQLFVDLEPFMMKSFRAENAVLSDFSVEVPSAYIASLKPEIESAKIFRENLASRRIGPEMTVQDVATALEQLDDAISAYDKGQYWRAHSQLERAALVRMEYASGHYISGVLKRSEPHGVKGFSGQQPEGWQVAWQQNPKFTKSIKALAYDNAGCLWAAAGNQVMSFAFDGSWKRNVTWFAPFTFDRKEGFDRGDVREATLYPPLLYAAQNIRPLPKGRMVAQKASEAPVIFDLKSGRAEKLLLANQLGTRGACSLLATDKSGNILVSSESGGVQMFSQDGTWLRKISSTSAKAAVVDRKGTIYLAGKKCIEILSFDGKETGQIEEAAVDHLAVSPDGSNLIAVKGHAVICFPATNAFKKSWSQEFPELITATAFSPQGFLTLAWDGKEKEGAVLKEFGLGVSGLQEGRSLVKVESVSAFLSISQPTQLKVLDGKLYWAAEGKLLRLIPGSAGGKDNVEVAYDPPFPAGKSFEAFAFAPNGDLYLSSFLHGSKKGINLYRCRKKESSWANPEYLNEGKPLFEAGSKGATDLAVNVEGQILVRGINPKSPANLALFSWIPGKTPQLLIDLGKSEVSEGEYGLQVSSKGDWLVAGGNLRGLWRLSPEGQIVWKTQRQKTTPPGYVDLRCPMSVTEDSSGRHWAADPTRHQILGFGSDGQWQQTLGGFGDEETTGKFSLNQPLGIAALKDSSGREWLYVADVGRNRLLKWPLPRSLR